MNDRNAYTDQDTKCNLKMPEKKHSATFFLSVKVPSKVSKHSSRALLTAYPYVSLGRDSVA